MSASSEELARQVSVNVVAEPFNWSADRARQLLRTVVDWFDQLSLPPNTFHARGGEFRSSKYLDFARGHKRLFGADFNVLTNVGCGRFKVKQNDTTIGWSVNLSLRRSWDVPEGGLADGYWKASLHIFPEFLGESRDELLEMIEHFAALTVGEYGYQYRMHRNRGPYHYAIPMGYEHLDHPQDRSSNEGMHLCSWSDEERVAGTLGDSPFLRDVYPANYLGPKLCRRVIEGVTLLNWLKAHGGGSLSSFKGNEGQEVWKWEPVAADIPALRERLYRDGLIYYRDGVQNPPPEFLQAKFFMDKGWDPTLTR